MKVVVFSKEFPPEVGGLETYSVTTADFLTRKGHDVTAFVRSLPGDRVFDETCGFEVRRYPELSGVSTRVCQPGSKVEIDTPYFTSWQSWADPTHVHHFTLRSFDYYIEHTPFGFRYTEPLFEIDERRVTFGRSFFDKIAKLIYRMSPTRYERRFSFMFPGRNLIIRLTAIK